MGKTWGTMASLWAVHVGARTFKRNGRTYQYAPRTVWRVGYRVWLPDHTARRKQRDLTDQKDARLLVGDAGQLEEKSQRELLRPEDIRLFHRLRLLSDEEAAMFLGRPAEATWPWLIDRYSEYSETRCRPATHSKNLSKAERVRSLLADAVPDPTRLTVGDIEAYVHARRAVGAQNKTVNNELDVLRKLLDPVFPDGQNPARRVAKLDAAKMGRLPRALTPDEDEQVLRAAWTHRTFLHGSLWRLYLIYRFAGLRREEALVLPWEHVLEDRVLVQEVRLHEDEISAAYTLTGNVWRPKEWEARAIPVPHFPLWAFRSFVKERSGRLVAHSGGRLIHPDVVSQSFKDIILVGGTTLHDLRHTFITALMESSVPPAVVQRLAGHRHLTTTERYTHVAVTGRVRKLEPLYRRLLRRL